MEGISRGVVALDLLPIKQFSRIGLFDTLSKKTIQFGRHF